MAIFSRYLLAYGRKPREASKKEAPPPDLGQLA